MYEIKLGLQALLRNRKRTLTTGGIIVLLITLVVLINTFMYTNHATRDLERELWYGSWSHAFTDESRSGAFKKVGTFYKISESVGSFDENMFELSNFEYYKGRKPQNENEVIVTLNALNTLGISYELNQSITINHNQFEIVGIIYNYNLDWNRIADMEYPSIITTNMTSTNAVYFGKANRLTPLFNTDDYLVVNTSAYPYIDTIGESFSQRTEELMIMNSQSLKLTQFMLIVMAVVLSVVYRNNAEFYQKRFEVLSQQGMTKWGLLRYTLPQLMFYGLVVMVAFYLIPTFIEGILVPVRQIRYNNNMNNLHYASIRASVMVVILHIFSIVSERFKIQQTFRLDFVHTVFVIIVSYLTVYISTPQTIALYEERIPQWKTYDQTWKASMFYIANGSLGGFAEEENPFSHTNAEWSLEDLEILLNHPKTKYVHYWNTRYTQYEDENSKIDFVGIHYFDDDMFHELEFPVNVSDDFLNGRSFYINGDNTHKIEVGDIVYFNDEPFYYEQNIYMNHTYVSGASATSGFLISTAGAKRIDFPTDKFNLFIVGVERMSNFIDYDSLVSRVAGRSYFLNARLNVERSVKREEGITIFMVLEVLIQYSIGLAILALLFLQRLMSKRKTLAIYHFLGESKTKLILKNSALFVVPALIMVLPSILMAGNLSTQFSSLIFSYVVGMVFIFVLLSVCLLIHINYVKEDLFELLNERE